MRGHLVRATAATVTAALVLLTLGFWWVLHDRLQREIALVLNERIHAVSALIVLDNGRLAVEETTGDEAIETGFWLYGARGRVVAAPATSPEVSGAAAILARSGHARRDVSRTRLLAAPAVVSGHRVGTIVVGVPLSAFQSTEHLALVAAAALDGVVLAGTILLTRRNVRHALAPVATMTATARAWSEHDLERRFDLGPPRDELTSLAATLDSLLGRISALIRHEQRLTAEIAHELRTPLARMHSSAEIAARHGTDAERAETLTEIDRETLHLASIVDTLLSAYAQSNAGTGTCDAQDLAPKLRELADRNPRADVDVDVDVVRTKDRVMIGCDEGLFLRAVSPLLSNAIRHARSRVTVTTTRTGHTVTVSVDDDGHGFAGDDIEHAFEPGFRGRSAGGSGSGLGLPLARRLARAGGGDVAVSSGPGGHVRLTLPSA
jgi:signal transduction histidine kinase